MGYLLLLLLEAGSYHIAKTDFEFLDSNYPSASDSTADEVDTFSNLLYTVVYMWDN